MLWTLSFSNKTGNGTSALTIKASGSWPKWDMKLRWKFRAMFSFRSPSTLTPGKLAMFEWRVFFHFQFVHSRNHKKRLHTTYRLLFFGLQYNMKLDVLHNFHYWYFFLFLIYCSSGRCSISLCQKSKYLGESTLSCFIRILRGFSLGEEKKWNRNMPKEKSLISIFLLLF